MNKDNINRTKSSSFLYSYYFLSSDKADAITTIYSFCRVSDDIVDNDKKNNKEKLEDLEKWESDFKDSLDGKSENELLNKTAGVINKYNINKKYFFDLIDGMRMDLTKSRYASFDELLEYCFRAASTVGLISIEIFGYRNPSAIEFAKNLGIALQLTNIIRDVRSDYQIGRIYLPENDLKRFNRSDDQFSPELIKYEISIAEKYYEKALEYLAEEDISSMMPALMMKDIYYGILRKIRKKRYYIGSDIIRISKAEKILIALNSYLRYKLMKIK